jgi:S-(hydroxymethyl)glutathione dehydrogenase/alcohol dehydrogenase
VIQGLKLAGADMIIGVDSERRQGGMGRKFGMTHFVNPKRSRGDVQPIVDMTKTPFDKIGGADYRSTAPATSR